MGARTRWSRLRALVVAVAALGAVVSSTGVVDAFTFVDTSPSFSDSTVGQTLPAALGIGNFSTPPESTTNPTLTISLIDLYPSCTNTAADCIGGTVETIIYGLSATGAGTSTPAGNVTCEGTWTISEASPGRWRFVPPGGEGTLLLSTGETCSISFTATTLRVPTVDVNAGQPGIQTNHVASSTATGPTVGPIRNFRSDTSTVARATPSITTTATPPAALGGTSTDSATLGAPAGVTVPPSAQATGAITFNLFGPNNPTCDAAGPIHSTSVVPVNNFGAPPHSSGPSNAVTAPGTYHWVATYSGDANYAAAGPTACLDPAETFTVAAPSPSITTTATPPAAPGGPSTDSATLGAPAGVTVPPSPAPTGTITFNLFGPNNPTCNAAGVVHSTSTVPVNNFGAPPHNSAASNPLTTPGTYHWVASYSGDANYAAAGPTACNDPAETFNVAPATVGLSTQASTNSTTVAPGTAVTDLATFTPPPGGPAPTGTVTYALVGPNPNAGCTAPVFGAPDTKPVGTASAPFTPTAPGAYNFVATYSGDANYAAVTTPVGCGDPAERFGVALQPLTLTTQASTNSTTTPPGTAVTDLATLTPPPGGPAPTGTVTYTLVGPNPNAGCTAPVFGAPSTAPVGNPSAAYSPTAGGTYNFVATYSGDANYAPITTPVGCGVAAERFTVVANGSVAVVKNSPADAQTVTFTFEIACDNATVSTRTITGSGTSAPVDNLPPGTRCVATEAHVDGFVDQPQQVFPAVTSSTTQTVTFTNVRTGATTGSVLVNKGAPANAAGQTFTFTITCAGAAGSPFTRTVTGSGSTAPVSGLAPGTNCTAHEEPTAGFVNQADQNFAPVTAGTTQTVAFTNTRVAPSADLDVDAVAATGFVAGQNAILHIDVTNNGPSPTSQGTIIVTVNLPAGVTFVSGGGAGFVCAPGAGGTTVTCTRTAPLAPGTIAGFDIVVAIAATATQGTITVTVVDPNVPDPVAGNNNAVVVLAIVPANQAVFFPTAGGPVFFVPAGGFAATPFFGTSPFFGANTAPGTFFLGQPGVSGFGGGALGSFLPFATAPAAAAPQQQQQQQQQTIVGGSSTPGPAAAPAAAAPAGAVQRQPAFTGAPTLTLTRLALFLLLLGAAGFYGGRAMVPGKRR